MLKAAAWPHCESGLEPGGGAAIDPQERFDESEIRAAEHRLAAAWVSGPAEAEPTTVEVRGMILWRKALDGGWRVAMEHIG